jgi:hypothetical protein
MCYPRRLPVRSGVRRPKPRRADLACSPLGLHRPPSGLHCPLPGFYRPATEGPPRLVLILCWVLGLGVSPSWAVQGVSFDVPATVECLPLTRTHEADETTLPVANTAPPASNGLIRVASYKPMVPERTARQYFLLTFDVTAVFDQPDRFEAISFELVPVSRTATIVDYEPKTMATSDWADAIDRESSRTKNANLNANLAAAFPGFGSGNFQLNGQGVANEVNRESLKAPLRAVITSGPSQRGRGVFYRFTAARESVIEGGQKLQIIVQTHDGWRGDLIQVHCSAKNSNERIERSFLTAAYLMNDPEGLDIAEHFARQEFRLQESLHQWSAKKRPTSLADDFESLFGIRHGSTEPVDVDRLRRSLLIANSQHTLSGWQRLPPVIQTIITGWLDRRDAVLRLARP